RHRAGRRQVEIDVPLSGPGQAVSGLGHGRLDVDRAPCDHDVERAVVRLHGYADAVRLPHRQGAGEIGHVNRTHGTFHHAVHRTGNGERGCRVRGAVRPGRWRHDLEHERVTDRG